MSTIDSANPPQEYPDIVGARPTNPFATNFKPFIPASAHLAELTWSHLITGTILGIIFDASSLYLVLKVGLTVSAFDTGGRAFNHILSRCVESSRRPRSIAGTRRRAQ